MLVSLFIYYCVVLGKLLLKNSEIKLLVWLHIGIYLNNICFDRHCFFYHVTLLFNSKSKALQTTVLFKKMYKKKSIMTNK